MNAQRVLPFRFLAAARYAPQWEEALEQAMLASVAAQEKLPGRTVLLVDVSGSMTAPLSRRSEMQRTDAAYGLAVLLREIGEKVAVYSFSDQLVEVPARRGFALRDAIDTSQRHNGTYLGKAVEELHRVRANHNERYDRLIVVTDEQAHDTVPNPKVNGYVDQRGELQERRRLRQVDAHRRLERVGRRVYPHPGAHGLGELKRSGRRERSTAVLKSSHLRSAF